MLNAIIYCYRMGYPNDLILYVQFFLEHIFPGLPFGVALLLFVYVILY